MKTDYWLKKWETNDIAFHEKTPNPLMASNFNDLSLTEGSRVFLPLCGKTRDIAWLLHNGYKVAGSELVESAIIQLFNELEMEPVISLVDELTLYSAKNLDIYIGDIFNMSRDTLGQVDAIYDRAALVALPKTVRKQYTSHLMAITENAPQLLISYEYDQAQMDGPPFSVGNKEISQHYNTRYDCKLVSSELVSGGLKGKCEASENVWVLTPLSY